MSDKLKTLVEQWDELMAPVNAEIKKAREHLDKAAKIAEKNGVAFQFEFCGIDHGYVSENILKLAQEQRRQDDDDDAWYDFVDEHLPRIDLSPESGGWIEFWDTSSLYC